MLGLGSPSVETSVVKLLCKLGGLGECHKHCCLGFAFSKILSSVFDHGHLCRDQRNKQIKMIVAHLSDTQ